FFQQRQLFFGQHHHLALLLRYGAVLHRQLVTARQRAWQALWAKFWPSVVDMKVDSGYSDLSLANFFQQRQLFFGQHHHLALLLRYGAVLHRQLVTA
ncbi:hypothetical protein, partial [Cronobacter sakazakii]|uniref:hypothetical protein n=1 Tax=Cronobacter sakazakii TaxID=28141 RepID=UPI001F23F0C4